MLMTRTHSTSTPTVHPYWTSAPIWVPQKHRGTPQFMTCGIQHLAEGICKVCMNHQVCLIVFCCSLSRNVPSNQPLSDDTSSLYSFSPTRFKYVNCSLFLPQELVLPRRLKISLVLPNALKCYCTLCQIWDWDINFSAVGEPVVVLGFWVSTSILYPAYHYQCQKACYSGSAWVQPSARPTTNITARQAAVGKGCKPATLIALGCWPFAFYRQLVLISCMYDNGAFGFLPWRNVGCALKQGSS